jgi:L-threonylcarbamoyladenylate synthase
LNVVVAREGLSAAAGARIAANRRAGGVVVFPTESFYALGADPLDREAVAKVFRLKGRAASQPLLVLLDSPAGVDRFAREIPAPWPPLMKRFWPGPLTLLFPAREGLPAGIVSPSGEVALRVPGSDLCRAVIVAAGGALTGTSANRSGEPSPVDAQPAAASLGPGADLVAALIVDGGTLPGGKVSTLLTPRGGRPVLLREGAVTMREVEGFLSE